MKLTHLILGGCAAVLFSAPQAAAASPSSDSLLDAFVPAIEFAGELQDPVDKPKPDKPKTGDEPKKRGKKGDRPKKGERKRKKGGNGDRPPHKRGKKGDRPGGTKDPERPDRP